MAFNVSNKSIHTKQKPRKPLPKTAEWRGFVNAELTEIHKEDLRANPFKLEEIGECFATMIADGCKMTISYDGKNSSYVASCTDRAPDSMNAGLTVSARGSTVINATQALMYKITIILKDTPWADNSRQTGPEDFS